MGEGALGGGDGGSSDGGGCGGDGGDGRRSWQIYESKSELGLKSALKCFDKS